MSSELDHQVENTPEAQGYLIPNTTENSQLENTLLESPADEQDRPISLEDLGYYDRGFLAWHPILHCIFSLTLMLGTLSCIAISVLWMVKYNRKLLDKETNV